MDNNIIDINRTLHWNIGNFNAVKDFVPLLMLMKKIKWERSALKALTRGPSKSCTHGGFLTFPMDN